MSEAGSAATSFGRPLGDHVAAVRAGAGAEVDELVGRADRGLVVLDDDHGVAQVAEPVEGLDQLLVVARVQADRRLVEDVQTPTRPEPIWVASRIRCASPPESVRAERARVR